MKSVTRLKVGPVAFLALLVLLAYLVVHRHGVTTEQAAGEAVGAVVTLEDEIDRDKYVAVAFIALLALFAFVTWTALGANGEEHKAMPPAGESSASDKTAFP